MAEGAPGTPSREHDEAVALVDFDGEVEIGHIFEDHVGLDVVEGEGTGASRCRSRAFSLCHSSNAARARDDQAREEEIVETREERIGERPS